ncbi:MAG: hypothetical protein ABW034_04880 [Steroidobacteraceae bacterium]
MADASQSSRLRWQRHVDHFQHNLFKTTDDVVTSREPHRDAQEMTREAVQQAERSVTYHYDADGSLLLKAKLPAEIGALVLKALEAATKEVPFDQVSETPSVKSAPAAPL